MGKRNKNKKKKNSNKKKNGNNKKNANKEKPNKKRLKPGAQKRYRKKDCVKVKFVLLLDKYPKDIEYWKISSVSDGKELMSGGNYDKTKKLKYEQCAKAACYNFEIKDSFGDGLAKGGKYDLYYKGTVVKKNGGKFGDKE